MSEPIVVRVIDRLSPDAPEYLVGKLAMLGHDGYLTTPSSSGVVRGYARKYVYKEVEVREA